MTVYSLDEKLKRLEEKLLLPDIRKSEKELTSLLADDFKEFGSSGMLYDKEQVILSLKNESPVEISIRNFDTIELAHDLYLVTYTALQLVPHAHNGFLQNFS